MTENNDAPSPDTHDSSSIEEVHPEPVSFTPTQVQTDTTITKISPRVFLGATLVIAGIITSGFLAFHYIYSPVDVDLADATVLNDDTNILYNQVFNGPYYEVWPCTKAEDCLKLAQTSFTPDDYQEANMVFLKETRLLYAEIEKLMTDVDETSYQTNISNIAKKYLTDESYILEKRRNFEYFNYFLFGFGNSFTKVESAVDFYENYTLPTEKTKEYIRSAFSNIEEGGSVEVDLFKISNVVYDINEEGKVIFPEATLSFPIILITKDRIAADLGGRNFTLMFDLVNVEGEWKYDLIESFRPEIEGAPRSVLFSIEDGTEIIEDYWNSIVMIAELSNKDTYPLFNEFYDWWLNASNNELNVFLQVAFDDYTPSGDDYAEIFHIFFTSQVPNEEKNIIYFKKMEEDGFGISDTSDFRVVKTKEGWALEL
jgi:hypothetical protein